MVIDVAMGGQSEKVAMSCMEEIVVVNVTVVVVVAVTPQIQVGEMLIIDTVISGILSVVVGVSSKNIFTIFDVFNLLDNTDAVMLGERSLLNIRVDTAGKTVGSLPDVPVKIKELSLVVIVVVVSLTRVVCLSLLVEMVEVIVVVGDV